MTGKTYIYARLADYADFNFRADPAGSIIRLLAVSFLSVLLVLAALPFEYLHRNEQKKYEAQEHDKPSPPNLRIV